VKASGLCNMHYNKKWRKENPIKAKNIKERYNKKIGREIINQRNRISRTKHRDKINKQKRVHYEKYKGRITKERRERYAVDEGYREARKQDRKNYERKNKSKVLRQKREKHQEIRERVMIHYSRGTPKCNECGYTGMPFLAIHHIYGRKQMRTDWGPGKLLRHLDKQHPPGYQILCHNCNLIKDLVRKKKHHKQTPMAKKRRRQRADTKKFVLDGYSKSSAECACCGNSNMDVLGLDHIVPIRRRNTGGRDEDVSDDLRSALKSEYKKTGKWKDGFQVLCENCNLAKSDKPFCPHKES